LTKLAIPFVEGQQDAGFSKRRGHNCQVGRTRKVLVENGVSVVFSQTQIRGKIDW
jgi:hypothetical protein